MTDTAATDAYNYDGLDKKSIEKAQKELRENPQQVRAHLTSLRRWLKSMPHLTAPEDDRFLLKFLRNAKFDHSVAQQALDNFCTIRSSPKGSPEWYTKPDVTDEVLIKVLECGVIVPIGYNDEGELLIVARFCDMDETITLDLQMSAVYAVLDVILDDEMCQINGVVLLEDMSGNNSKMLNQFSSPKVMFKAIRNWQDAMPMRVKGVIYYKEPKLLDVIMPIAMQFMKPWLRKRIVRCGSNLKKMHKHMGGASTVERLLPEEYGGGAGPLADLVARFKARVLASQAMFDRLATIYVDETKRLPATANYLATFDAATDMESGARGTYTKLNVD